MLPGRWQRRRTLRLIVTGGGTGGHVFPALEIARTAADRGDDVRFMGSLRGQEGRACERAGIRFQGFPSQPIPAKASIRFLVASLAYLRAASQARKALEVARPDAVFSTGGYSSAPVVRAARKLGIPYVLHEQNAVPGRANHAFSAEANGVCTVFHTAKQFFPREARVERTGMPIRRELRNSAQGTLGFAQALSREAPIVLVVGGSQGAAALNDVALATAVRMARTSVQWIHITGAAGYDATLESMRKLAVTSHYLVRAYLEAEDMASALFSCSLVVGRSGGSLAELAAFRKPSVLVPYPHSMGDHQRKNAQEFADIGAALVIDQKDLLPSTLEARIRLWLDEGEARQNAEQALAEWDVPDASNRVLAVLDRASKSGQTQVADRSSTDFKHSGVGR